MLNNIVKRISDFSSAITGEKRSNVVWIASYPRSGNKWFRCMLGYLMSNGQFLMSSNNSINEIIPNIHLQVSKSHLRKDFAPIKTHFLPNHPISLSYKAQKAIYIVRNPGDIIASSYKFLQRQGKIPLDETGEELIDSAKFQDFAADFIEQQGYSDWEKDFGTWTSSVNQWLSGGLPYEVYPVQFSLLSHKPEQVLKGVANFLELDIPEFLFGESVQKNSISESRKREPNNKGIGLGVSGYGFQQLSQANKEKFLENFGTLLKRIEQG
ncbi:MAG: sulfotransferase domain-containing protein [Leptolyngbyaceae cyanobacterium]